MSGDDILFTRMTRDEHRAVTTGLIMLSDAVNEENPGSGDRHEALANRLRDERHAIREGAPTPLAAEDPTAEDCRATTDEEWQWIEDLQEAAFSMTVRTQNLERMGYTTQAAKLRERWSRFHARVQKMKAQARQRDRNARSLKSTVEGES